jgi:antagonist of KipI
MSLRIVKPGICTTVQDLGRNGYQAAGITAGGVMDTLAAAVANYITGNTVHEAVIEMSFPAPVITFNQSAIIAITGADFSPSLNGTVLQNYKPLSVQPGDTLIFEKKVWGAWACLAINGGFAAEQWLGSYSTHIAAGAGGFKGRALQKEDILEFKKALPQAPINFNWQLAEKEWRQWYDADNVINLLPGNELPLLDDTARKKFFAEKFAVTGQSNRMGYRLSGPLLQLALPVELVSSAVTKGTVQLLPSGDCIVLMADCQTTGGYPRIAHITGASMPAMAQAQGGTQIKFRLINIEAAEESLFSMQKWLQQVRMICREKYGGYI